MFGNVPCFWCNPGNPCKDHLGGPPRPTPTRPVPPSDGADGLYQRRVRGEITRITDKLGDLAADSGQRHDQLINTANYCFKLANGGGVDHGWVRAQLEYACDRNGYTQGHPGRTGPDIDDCENNVGPEVDYLDDRPHDSTGSAYGNTDFGPNLIEETGEDGQPTEAAIAAREAWEKLVQHRANEIRRDREARRLVDAEDRPKIEFPPVRSLTDLLSQPLPPTQWRVDQLAQADGHNILSAQFKAGKTTVRDNLIRSLVDSEPFLGKFAVHRPAAGLVLIDNELSDRMVQDWLARQKIRNTDAVADVITLRGKVSTFNIFDDACRADWAARLRDVGCDYLILDCLRPVLDAFGLSEDKDAGKFLVPFDALLDEAGIRDALIVHHMGHQGERSRGDSRLQDWPDATWRLMRENEDPSSERFFTAFGRDVNVSEGRLIFDEATHRLTYAEGSRGDAKTEAALQDVLALLAADKEGGLSGRAIETGLGTYGHTQKAIRAAINLAVVQQLVEVQPGPKRSKLHRIAEPCATCGLPVTSGQGLNHLECATEVAA